MSGSHCTWKENGLIVFLGAGASFDTGLPLGDTGARQIVEDIFQELRIECGNDKSLRKWPRFEVVVDILEQYIPGSALSIVKSFAGIGLGATHKALAKLSRAGWVFLTTNFDDQCERAHKEIGKGVHVIRNRARINEIASLANARPLLIKLHGDGDVEDAHRDLGASIRQILTTFPPLAIESITALVQAKRVVFIGYSARDPDLLPLIRSMIQVASDVAWIGLTETSKLSDDQCRRFESLLGPQWTQRYISGGAQHILEGEVREKIEPLKSDAWNINIKKWVAAQDGYDLALALAAICQFQGHKILVERALEQAPIRGTMDAKKLEIQLKHLCQIGQAKEAGNLAVQYEPKLNLVNGDEKLRAARILSLAHHNASQFREAMELLQSVVAGEAKKDLTPDLIQATARLGLEQIYVGGEQFESGLNHLREAMKMAYALDDKVLECEARRWLAIGLIRYAHSPSEYDEGMKEANEVLSLRLEMGDPRGVLDAKNIIAAALWKKWEAPKALKLYEEIQQSAEELSDMEMIGLAMVNRALCHIALDENPLLTADPLLREAEVMSRKNPQHGVVASSLLHRGYLRVCCCIWREAVSYLVEAADAYLELGDREGAGYSLVLAAWAQLRSGSIGDARATFERIQRESLVPQGEHRVDFEMLVFALTCDLGLREDRILEVEERFIHAHEQRFQLLLLMLEASHQSADRDALERVVAALGSAAEKTAYKVLGKVWERAVIANLRLN